ncbi:MAG: glycyl radical protein [Desulfovibrio sp.]|uniref:glycyl radical protein n=1 Tax=Desulfovibrio sp. 7SRBS1 TaxID=3378064 RepID=UPI003B416B88
MAIEKGFGTLSPRAKRLKDELMNAQPRVECERAVLVTEAYKETEDLPIILRRAKAAEKIFNNIPTPIRDGELIVGATSDAPRSAEIFPEFSFEWVEKEFDTMHDRVADPFTITKEVANDLSGAFKYWPGKTVFDRASSYMSPETHACMNNGLFTVGNYFYGGIGHVCVDYGKVLRIGFSGIIVETMEALDKLDHSDPSYIEKTQFYNAIIITYTAAINYARRYAAKAEEMARMETNPTRKAELMQIAKNCSNVPEKGASNFYEALQSFWFVQCLLQIESSGHSISPGRFDQYINPYLEADKSISREFAQELMDCLWIKFNDVSKIRDEVSAQAFAGWGTFQNLCVGGQTSGGLDATNEVSYMCMESAGRVGMPQPSFSIRVWQGTPDEFLFRASEVVRLGYGYPAMYNDETIMPALQNRGVSLEDARDYCLIGCVEPQAMHRTDGWHDAAFFNVAKVLEITLNNGRVGDLQLGPQTGELTDFKCLDELFDAFHKQLSHFIYYLAEACNSVDLAHAERAPLPFLSALVDDCIAAGKSVQNGGARYNFTGPQAFGIADSGDSLYAIQKNVFEDGRLTMAQIKDGLDNNFGFPVGGSDANPAGSGANVTEDQVYEAVRKALSSGGSMDIASFKNEVYRTLGASTSAVNKAAAPAATSNYAELRRILDNTDSFGNDIDSVDMVARKCAELYCREVEKYRNVRGGGQFQAGIYPVSANVLFGKDVLALPDGRLAKQPLADGVSPRQGQDHNGPTAAANSVAKLDHFLASNGTLYNQKFLPSALAGDQGLKNFAGMVRGYFDRKGMHVQFNVVDRAVLLDAQKHPENHKDLVVRVAGYSAQFVILAKEVQDDIISRTEQTF